MGSIRVSIEEKLGPLPHFLIYVVLEWLVIILIFLDGILAFLSNEIARVFELRIPCLLCTRIDHLLVHRDSSFYYNDSICELHKKDISTLAYCHVHRKISDIRTMCQRCLLSFTVDKDAHCLADDERRLLLRPLKKDDAETTHDDAAGGLRCSCCGDRLKPKSTSSKLNRSLSMNSPVSSPRALWLSANKSELHLDENGSHAHSHGEDGKVVSMSLLPNSEQLNDDSAGTPGHKNGNKFFGISLSDPLSPKWGNRSIRKLASFDKLDVVAESDESDGLDIVARLKKQLEEERRSKMALYMELDEERSASAIAANNAMAMITRLQAEKAAVQMEALQYQRMMEEQAEYDQEALQMMRDIVFKREDEIKELESEVERYRVKYGEMKEVRSEIYEFDVDDDYQDINSREFSDDAMDE